MKKSTKIWLVAATSLAAIGVLMFAGVMTAYHWDFSRLSTDHFETNTYEISEEFSSIKMNTETADILFAASDDNTCRVVCYEDENMKHSASVHNGTLTVKAVDDRAWYEHIGISFHSPRITVYLPKAEYASIAVEASTGDIEISDEIRIDTAGISLSTGDIKIRNMSADILDLSVTTGEIVLSDVTCTGNIIANTATGDVKAVNTECRNFISNGSTSDVSLKNVIASEKISLERSTGDVKFDSSDAGEISVKTSTGDVRGSLLTEKVFITDTSTGDISVPKTTAGGKCEISTSTGDIDIEVD